VKPGLTVVLTLVTLVAVGVSFAAGRKTRNGQGQITTLQGQVESLHKTRKVLEVDLREAQERYAKEELASKNLKEALSREQLKNEILTQELHRQQKKAISDAKTSLPAQESKSSTGNVAASSNIP